MDQIWAWLPRGHLLAVGVRDPLKSSVTGLSLLVKCYLEIKFHKKIPIGPPLKSLNATLLSNISKVSENLESNFVKITNGDIPIIFGALYRPPSGDIDKALTELAEILDELPKKCYIGGDFNIDLHDKKRNKHIQELEDITMSRGFFPLISIATHVKPGCKPSCIDNLITNDIENILISGIIEEKISHHFPVFHIFNSDMKPIKNTSKYIQYYDYCNSNVDNFVTSIENELNFYEITNFDMFIEKFRQQLDNNCKLDVPKESKRTVQNNPWITPGLIASIKHCHDLYKAWAKSRKVLCNEGEKDNRGRSCLCFLKNVSGIENIVITGVFLKRPVIMQSISSTMVSLRKMKVT